MAAALLPSRGLVQHPGERAQRGLQLRVNLVLQRPYPLRQSTRLWVGRDWTARYPWIVETALRIRSPGFVDGVSDSKGLLVAKLENRGGLV
jgi:hypothetical protein